MPKVEIVRDDAKAKATGGKRVYTFTVDGQASGYWTPECKVDGLPPTYYVERVVRRLEQGRSREAFGNSGPAVAGGGHIMTAASASATTGRARILRADGEPKVEMRATKGGEKPRTVEPGWRAEVDGKDLGKEFPTEQAARVAAAFAAFMSRGKLGRLQEAKAAFESATGKKCEVKYDGKSVVVVEEGGATHAVALRPGETPRFKPLT